MQFKLKTSFQPAGDQPHAIGKIIKGIQEAKKHQVLLGVTGSGKTFTMANVIEKLQKTTLVLAPNKTLAAQLFSEFRQFFPENAVEYFVSYYDYYQPEAYIPSTDTYIEKDSAINDEIDKLRHSATRSLLDRNDVIIVSSVSCIYGLGSPEAYEGLILYLEEGKECKRGDLLLKLVEIQYTRKDIDFHRGTFRVRGDIIDVFPAYEEERAIRIELFGDSIEALYVLDPLRGTKHEKLSRTTIYPASHYVTTLEIRKQAIESIRIELREKLKEYRAAGKEIEAKRLESRTLFDLEMLETLGYCQGIENYSRHLTGRLPGAAPPTLLEYFPKDFLLFIDESHVTIPQVGGMYRGDRARKLTLVEHGFRLPSALDNRPLNFQEFEACSGFRLYVSATPGPYELTESAGQVIEQIIRPTGLVDPDVVIKPASSDHVGQVEDLLHEIKKVVAKGYRILVTTLTKKLAEDLTGYYLKNDIRVKYMHSDIETLERVEILRGLRQGSFDVLVGINLLREGLDLPEVALVAVLDADKEGFLRSTTSLIQTIGRAARNIDGRVILYADKQTQSIKNAIGETDRRRQIQIDYNKKHGITPQTVTKAEQVRITGSGAVYEDRSILHSVAFASRKSSDPACSGKSSGELENAALEKLIQVGLEEIPKDTKIFSKKILELETQMREAAKNLEFEKAGVLRDQIRTLKQAELTLR